MSFYKKQCRETLFLRLQAKVRFDASSLLEASALLLLLLAFVCGAGTWNHWRNYEFAEFLCLFVWRRIAVCKWRREFQWLAWKVVDCAESCLVCCVKNDVYELCSLVNRKILKKTLCCCMYDIACRRNLADRNESACLNLPWKKIGKT